MIQIKSLRIKGKLWKIFWKDGVIDLEGKVCSGLTVWPDRKIFININNTEEQLLITLIHEYAHACVMEVGGMDQSISMDHEHLIIEAIASCFHENKKIFKKVF